MVSRDHAENSRAEVILILGGARSGKSRYAQQIASSFGQKGLFVATAQAADKEMAERIEKHRRDRGDTWETCEEPVEIDRVIEESHKDYGVILVDCLTLWVSNLLFVDGNDLIKITSRIDRLIDCLTGVQATTVLVSNEVGLGIVPENPISRSFRDLTGMLHQRIAEVADRVILMVAGIPLHVKPSK